MKFANYPLIICTLCFSYSCTGPIYLSIPAYEYPDFNLAGIKSIAVLEFNCNEPNLGRQMTDVFTSKIQQIGYFTLVERDQIKPLIEEFKLNLGGLTQEEFAPKIGQLANVDAVIVGFVNGDISKNTINETKYKTVNNIKYEQVLETVYETKYQWQWNGVQWVHVPVQVPVTKLVPKQIPVFEKKAYNEQFLITNGYLSTSIKLIDVNSGEVITTKTATRESSLKTLLHSTEPPTNLVPLTEAKSLDTIIHGTIAEITDIIANAKKNDFKGHGSTESGILFDLCSSVANELASQITPHKTTVSRGLKRGNSKINQGIDLANNSQWEKAKKIWQNILKEKDIKSHATWNNLGVYYELKGLYSKAKVCYEQAINLKPDENIYYDNLDNLESRMSAISKQTGVIGITMEETSLGILVTDIIAGSKAIKAGIQRGDIIKKANGEEITEITDLQNKIRDVTRKRGLLNLVIKRGQRLLQTKIDFSLH